MNNNIKILNTIFVDIVEKKNGQHFYEIKKKWEEVVDNILDKKDVVLVKVIKKNDFMEICVACRHGAATMDILSKKQIIIDRIRSLLGIVFDDVVVKTDSSFFKNL